MAEHSIHCLQQHHSTQQFGHHQQQLQQYDHEGATRPFYPSQQQQHYQQQQFEHQGASHQYHHQQYQGEPQFGQQRRAPQQFTHSQVGHLQRDDDGQLYPPPQGPMPVMHPHHQYESAFYPHDQRQVGIHEQQQQHHEPENLHLCSKCDFRSETAVDMAMHSVHEHGDNN